MVFLSKWCLSTSLLIAVGCASVPTPPPTADDLKQQIANDGQVETLRKHQVQVDGNAFTGHEVKIGNDDERTAPARYYFANAPFEVEHLNGWAGVPSLIGLMGGMLVTSTLSILMTVDVIRPVDALIGLAGCAIPLFGVSALFSVIGEWDIPAAGEDYNAKLKVFVDEQSVTTSTSQTAPAQY